MTVNSPSITEFDGWRASPTSQWFFEVFLQGYADAMAGENGRGVGRIEETADRELLTFVRNAGVISGVEIAINIDPFEDEREEIDE